MGQLDLERGRAAGRLFFSSALDPCPDRAVAIAETEQCGSLQISKRGKGEYS